MKGLGDGPTDRPINQLTKQLLDSFSAREIIAGATESDSLKKEDKT